MRTDSAAFAAINSSSSKEPRFVVEISFDSASTDLYYLTSHSDAFLPVGATQYTHRAIARRGISGTTQKIDPRNGRSTIGAITVKALDIGDELTTIISTKLAAGDGLRGKRVRVYMGFNDASFTAFTDYQLIQTQIVESVSFDSKSRSYSFRLADIQRKMREDIFDLASTNITSTVSDTDTTINVISTSGFELVEHGTSYTDAPSATVGYIKIGDEVIRYTGTTSTTFTGCTRAVLNTKAAIHEISSGSDDDRQPEVEEFVYLEMPAVKLAYALLTGSIYNQAATLPENWHLGISTTFVQTSAFINVGSDWWDPSDDTTGVIVRFTGTDKTDGKKFIEKELMLLLGAFMPVLADGSLSLKRMAAVLAGSATVTTLNSDNVSKGGIGTLNHDAKQVSNQYEISWNYDHIQDKTTRKNILIDGASISAHGEAPITRLAFLGMAGNRFTSETLAQRFDALRDRYAGPPELIKLNCLPSMNVLEVGDVVRVTLDAVNDYAGSTTTLDRAFEVQSTSIDWITGKVSVDLFGSSQSAGALAATSGQSSVIPDAYYTGAGTNINTLTGYANISGVGHLQSNITITGNADMTAAGAIYYHDGDLEIDAGVTITITENVQFRVKGNLQINGKIDGAGGATTAIGDGLIYSLNAGGGIDARESPLGTSFLIAFPGDIGSADTLYSTLPQMDVTYDGSALAGLLSDFRGEKGSTGGAIIGDRSAAGGVGGLGGAGFAVISRGAAFGGSGEIDLSGSAGSAGGSALLVNTHYAGGGAGGAPGSAAFFIDGDLSTPPSLTDSVITSAYGARGAMAGSRMAEQLVWAKNGSYHSYYIGNLGNFTTGGAAYRVQYVLGEQAPVEDVQEFTSDPSALILAEYTNTPKSANADLSTIEATVTPPADGNYSHSNIYYRVNGSGDDYTSVTVPASPESTFVVASDGVEYEVIAKSVSIAGFESPAGPTATITTTNTITPTVTDTPIEEVILVPNVSGLELFEQGNDAEFVGRDPVFVWRKTAITDFFELGREPDGIGGDAGSLDLYFQNYVVNIYDPATETLIHTDRPKDNVFQYGYEQNAIDYKRINGTDGAYRQFRIEVLVETRLNQISSIPAKLVVNNPAPALPSSVTVSASFQTVVLDFLTDELDFAGVKVWMGTSTGFVRDDTSLFFDGNATTATITGLTSGQTYYLRFALYDTFGDDVLNESAEYTVTTQAAITSGEVSGLSNWATRIIPADLAFMNANTEADSIESTRIESVIAGKIAAGTIASRVAVSGVFVATGTEAVFNETGLTAGTWRADWGPVSDGGTVYIARYHDDLGNKKFSLDDAGNVVVSGSITITGGTGVANLADAGGLATSDRADLLYTDGADVTAANTAADATTVTGTINGASDRNTAVTNSVEAGTTITAGGITMSAGGSIKGGQTAYDTGVGFFLGYSGAAYKFSIGDSTGNKLTYDGATALDFTGTITASTFKTATSGQRVEINPASDNEIHFYGDRGDTTIEELATIGKTAVGADYAIGKFGSANLTGAHAIWAESNDSTRAAIRVYINANDGSGIDIDGNGSQGITAEVRGTNANTYGGYFIGSYQSSSTAYGIYARGHYTGGTTVVGHGALLVSGPYRGYGAICQNTAGTATNSAPIRLLPSSSSSAPSHAAEIGALWVTSTGVLYINTSGSTTWAKVGAQ